MTSYTSYISKYMVLIPPIGSSVHHMEFTVTSIIPATGNPASFSFTNCATVIESYLLVFELFWNTGARTAIAFAKSVKYTTTVPVAKSTSTTY